LKSIESVFGNEVVLNTSTIEHVLKRHPEFKKFHDLEESIVSVAVPPDLVLAGRYGENIAAKKIMAGISKDKWLMVPYEEDGMVKTVFVVSDVEKLTKKRFVLWRR